MRGSGARRSPLAGRGTSPAARRAGRCPGAGRGRPARARRCARSIAARSGPSPASQSSNAIPRAASRAAASSRSPWPLTGTRRAGQSSTGVARGGMPVGGAGGSATPMCTTTARSKASGATSRARHRQHLPGDEAAESRRAQLLGEQVVEEDVVAVRGEAPGDAAHRARAHGERGGEVRPVGMDVVGAPVAGDPREPDALRGGDRVGDRPAAGPGPPEAPEAPGRAARRAYQRDRHRGDDGAGSRQDPRAWQQRADVVVHHRHRGSSRGTISSSWPAASSASTSGTTKVSPSPNGSRWVTYTIFTARRSRDWWPRRDGAGATRRRSGARRRSRRRSPARRRRSPAARSGRRAPRPPGGGTRRPARAAGRPGRRSRPIELWPACMKRAIEATEMTMPLAESRATASMGEPRLVPMSSAPSRSANSKAANASAEPCHSRTLRSPLERVAHQPHGEPGRQGLGVAPRLLPLAAHHRREEPGPAEPDRAEDRQPAGEQRERGALGEPAQRLRLPGQRRPPARGTPGRPPAPPASSAAPASCS